jgi:hypothetical protein
MKIFMFAPDATSLSFFEPAFFERALRGRWPNAKLDQPTSPDDTHARDWEIVMRHGLVVGWFGRDGVTMICDGDIRDCGEIALWYRSIVPQTQLLVVYDESYAVSVELRSGVALDDLVGPFTT